MDNIKTGALIRERRKEKGLTQRELAERLHVTDRAVSKWKPVFARPTSRCLNLCLRRWT